MASKPSRNACRRLTASRLMLLSRRASWYAAISSSEAFFEGFFGVGACWKSIGMTDVTYINISSQEV